MFAESLVLLSGIFSRQTGHLEYKHPRRRFQNRNTLTLQLNTYKLNVQNDAKS